MKKHKAMKNQTLVSPECKRKHKNSIKKQKIHGKIRAKRQHAKRFKRRFKDNKI